MLWPRSCDVVRAMIIMSGIPYLVCVCRLFGDCGKLSCHSCASPVSVTL